MTDNQELTEKELDERKAALNQRIEYFTHHLNAWTSREQNIIDCLKEASKQLTQTQQALDRAVEAIEELKERLPKGMKNCTIIFKECEVGHGRLMGTNWVDSGCTKCRLDSAVEALEKVIEKCKSMEGDKEFQPYTYKTQRILEITEAALASIKRWL